MERLLYSLGEYRTRSACAILISYLLDSIMKPNIHEPRNLDRRTKLNQSRCFFAESAPDDREFLTFNMQGWRIFTVSFRIFPGSGRIFEMKMSIWDGGKCQNNKIAYVTQEKGNSLIGTSKHKSEIVDIIIIGRL